MSSELVRGDILVADALALVIPVDTAGVMGKGLALQLRTADPGNFREYRRAGPAG